MTSKERKLIINLCQQIVALIELDERTYNTPQRARGGSVEGLVKARAIQAEQRMAARRAKLQAELDSLDDKLTAPTTTATTNGAAK